MKDNFQSNILAASLEAKLEIGQFLIELSKFVHGYEAERYIKKELRVRFRDE